MKILVINNHTQHLPDLMASLHGHDIEIRTYEPGLDFECDDKDLVLLSGGGGEGLEIHDEHQPGRLWYEDQIKFIQTSTKPIVGICMGFEVICRAFGAKVEKLSKGVNGPTNIQLTKSGRNRLNKNQLEQFEAHEWAVQTAPAYFNVLATSNTGVEIIQHQKRPIFATQFHPEKPGSLSLQELIEQVA